MKILILQDDFPPHHAGGAAVVAYNLAKGFKKSGHDILVITTVQKRSLVGRETMDGIEVERLFSEYHERWRGYLSLYNPQTIPALKKIMKKWQPDIVHVHNVHWYLSYHSLKIAGYTGAKVFLTAHDGMLFHYGKPHDDKRVSALELMKSYRLRYNPLRNYCIRRYLRYVTNIVAVSDALKRALNNNDISNVHVIHNGIDVERWIEPEESVETFKKHYGLGDSVILFGGRLSGSKGAGKMIEALDIIVKTIPNTQLLIVGQKDAYAQKMLVQAQERGVVDGILFTGWISGHILHQAYHAASVVAVPSLYLDPFPTVNLEAMACNKPVVATCFGGSVEVVSDGITGYIVDPFDVPTMAAKIAEILKDKEKKKVFGQAGYEKVTKEFTLEKQTATYERIFVSSGKDAESLNTVI